MSATRGHESMSDKWKSSKSSGGGLDKTPPGDWDLQLGRLDFRARHSQMPM
jgi:hypothetical protein